jgi:hypothetical protein
LKPGRELDKLIGERAMNLEVHQAGAHDMIFSVNREWITAGGYYYFVDGEGAYRLSPYSTEDAPSLEVVKEMARRGLTAHIEWKGKGREFEYTAEVTFLDHGILGLGHAVADTISHAACIAALEALDADN